MIVGCRSLIPVVMAIALPSVVAADDRVTKSEPRATPPRPAEVLASQPTGHPLDWTLEYATARLDYLRENVRDYTCRLVKRERIEGELQSPQLIEVMVRCDPKSVSGQAKLVSTEPAESVPASGAATVAKPFAVFMRYLAPRTLKDRRVLFIAGENDSKVLVRKGGSLLSYVQVQIDPDSATARRESNYPITDIGFDKIVERLIDRINRDIERDPQGNNTIVAHFRNAKVKDRLCTHIQVKHPDPLPGFEFHRASLYVDNELHVPIRLVVHDWPKEEPPVSELADATPPLIEEYTYLDLKVNVGLTDEAFSAKKLEGAPDE